MTYLKIGSPLSPFFWKVSRIHPVLDFLGENFAIDFGLRICRISAPAYPGPADFEWLPVAMPMPRCDRGLRGLEFAVMWNHKRCAAKLEKAAFVRCQHVGIWRAIIEAS